MKTKVKFKPNCEGIFPNLSEAVYRAAPGVCQSDLQYAAMSAAHYKAQRDLPRPKPTRAEIIGTATHKSVLENRREFVLRPDKFPDFRTDEAKAWRDAQTLPIIDEQEKAQIVNMTKAVWAHPYASRILSAGGINEVSRFRWHRGTDLLLKGRADRVVTDSIGNMVVVELKTEELGGARIESFSKSIEHWNYHRQATFYIDLFDANTFVFIVAEKAPPYAVAVYELDSADIEQGRELNERDLRVVSLCTEMDAWPGYPDGVQVVGRPLWARRKILGI